MIAKDVRPATMGECLQEAFESAHTSFVDRARGFQSREELAHNVRTNMNLEASVNQAGNLCVAVTHNYSAYSAPHLEYFVYQPTTPDNYEATFSTLTQ